MSGRRRDLGLGAWPEVTVAMARDRSLEAKRKVAEGIDPLAEKHKIAALTFENAAMALIESKRSGWRDEKHAAQWPSTLKTYAFPKLGRMDVREVDTQGMLTVLRPIWTEKPETASRVRQRIEAVLDYASAIGARTGDNPARWRGQLDHLLPKPTKVRAVKHHPAMPWREVPAFLLALSEREGMAARALAFVILTAARSGEVRGMRWSEIDLADHVWTIPSERMKAGKEHRVPLTDDAIQLLGNPRAAEDFVFPGGKYLDNPLSDMSLTAVLRRMDYKDITVHGFRSSFRDWAGETTAFPREVIEAALAHRLKDKAEAAYARGDLFDKRRDLMRARSEYLAGNSFRLVRT